MFQAKDINSCKTSRLRNQGKVWRGALKKGLLKPLEEADLVATYLTDKKVEAHLLGLQSVAHCQAAGGQEIIFHHSLFSHIGDWRQACCQCLCRNQEFLIRILHPTGMSLDG